MSSMRLLQAVLSLLVVICIGMFFTTCNKDDSTTGPAGPTPLTTINFTDPTPAVTLSATGGAESRKIAGGTLPLTITSAPTPAVATAAIHTDTLTVTPVGQGTTSLTITDSSPIPGGALPRTLIIGITVSGGSTLIAFPANLTVGVGAVAASKISNGTTPYSIQTPPGASFASALMQNDSLKVTGIAAGNTSVVVRDASATPKTVTVPIVVTAGGGGLTATPTQVMVQVNHQLAAQISGGTMPYSIQTPPDTHFASVTQSNDIFVVNGNAVGNTSMVIRDASSPALTVTLPIIVTSGTGNITITVGAGNTPTFSWTGGTGTGVQQLNVVNTSTGTPVWDIVCISGTNCIASPVTCGTVPAGVYEVHRSGIPLTPGIVYQVVVSRTNLDLGSALFTP